MHAAPDTTHVPVEGFTCTYMYTALRRLWGSKNHDEIWRGNGERRSHRSKEKAVENTFVENITFLNEFLKKKQTKRKERVS